MAKNKYYAIRKGIKRVYLKIGVTVRLPLQDIAMRSLKVFPLWKKLKIIWIMA